VCQLKSWVVLDLEEGLGAKKEGAVRICIEALQCSIPAQSVRICCGKARSL
jgi:hypothetical protein